MEYRSVAITRNLEDRSIFFRGGYFIFPLPFEPAGYARVSPNSNRARPIEVTQSSHGIDIFQPYIVGFYLLCINHTTNQLHHVPLIFTSQL